MLVLTPHLTDCSTFLLCLGSVWMWGLSGVFHHIGNWGWFSWSGCSSSPPPPPSRTLQEVNVGLGGWWPLCCLRNMMRLLKLTVQDHLQDRAGKTTNQEITESCLRSWNSDGIRFSWNWLSGMRSQWNGHGNWISMRLWGNRFLGDCLPINPCDLPVMSLQWDCENMVITHDWDCGELDSYRIGWKQISYR